MNREIDIHMYALFNFRICIHIYKQIPTYTLENIYESICTLQVFRYKCLRDYILFVRSK